MAEQADAKLTDPANQKSLWEMAEVRIGVVSGALGLIALVLGLPSQIAAAFGGTEPQIDPAVAAEVERSRPILDVRYVLLSDDLLGWRRSMEGSADEQGGEPQPEPSQTARSLLSLPMVTSEVSAESDDQLWPPEAEDGQLFKQTAFLLVENRGRRDATGITLHAQKLTFAAAPEVNEGSTASGDYVVALRRASSGTSAATIRVPRTLGPGDAVLVPVFVSMSPHGRPDRWWVVSRSAMLPDSLTYLDPVIERRRSALVRRMVNPTLVERGIMDRG